MDDRGPLQPGAPIAVRLLATLGLLLLAGCDSLRHDQFLPLWAALPFAILFGVGWLFVFERRRGQLRGWDLRQMPNDPGVSSISGQLIGAATVVFLVFAIYNGFLEGAATTLRLENVGLWLLGSVVGVVLALFLGLKSAERSFGSSGKE
ncbi:MAG TPA: hypothetical protein VGE98_08770 [Thermoanaerobaculia bacterium]